MRDKTYKIKKVLIEASPYDQWKNTGDKEWAGKTCAICSLKTMLVFKDHNNSKLEIMKLVKEGLDKDGFSEGVGWKHQVLLDIARDHGVELKFQKLFFKGDDKIKALDFINKNLLKGWPVMVSILNKKKNGGHMVVVNGFEAKGKKLENYFILDPDSRGRNRYALSELEFLNIWRGGMLWFY